MEDQPMTLPQEGQSSAVTEQATLSGLLSGAYGFHRTFAINVV